MDTGNQDGDGSASLGLFAGPGSVSGRSSAGGGSPRAMGADSPSMMRASTDSAFHYYGSGSNESSAGVDGSGGGGGGNGGGGGGGGFGRDGRVFDRNATSFTGHFDDRKN